MTLASSANVSLGGAAPARPPCGGGALPDYMSAMGEWFRAEACVGTRCGDACSAMWPRRLVRASPVEAGPATFTARRLVSDASPLKMRPYDIRGKARRADSCHAGTSRIAVSGIVGSGGPMGSTWGRCRGLGSTPKTAPDRLEIVLASASPRVAHGANPGRPLIDPGTTPDPCLTGLAANSRRPQLVDRGPTASK